MRIKIIEQISDADYKAAGIPERESRQAHQAFSNVPVASKPLMNEREPLRLEDVSLANFTDPDKWKLL